MLLAGIDIGTLTCRLLIAEVAADSSMKEIDSDRRILRLGERGGSEQIFAFGRDVKSPRSLVRVAGSHAVLSSG